MWMRLSSSAGVQLLCLRELTAEDGPLEFRDFLIHMLRHHASILSLRVQPDDAPSQRASLANMFDVSSLRQEKTGTR